MVGFFVRIFCHSANMWKGILSQSHWSLIGYVSVTWVEIDYKIRTLGANYSHIYQESTTLGSEFRQIKHSAIMKTAGAINIFAVWIRKSSVTVKVNSSQTLVCITITMRTVKEHEV